MINLQQQAVQGNNKVQELLSRMLELGIVAYNSSNMVVNPVELTVNEHAERYKQTLSKGALVAQDADEAGKTYATAYELIVDVPEKDPFPLVMFGNGSQSEIRANELCELNDLVGELETELPKALKAILSYTRALEMQRDIYKHDYERVDKIALHARELALSVLNAPNSDNSKILAQLVLESFR